jgi:hypothetical protein
MPTSMHIEDVNIDLTWLCTALLRAWAYILTKHYQRCYSVSTTTKHHMITTIWKGVAAGPCPPPNDPFLDPTQQVFVSLVLGEMIALA